MFNLGQGHSSAFPEYTLLFETYSGRLIEREQHIAKGTHPSLLCQISPPIIIISLHKTRLGCSIYLFYSEVSCCAENFEPQKLQEHQEERNGESFDIHSEFQMHPSI